MQYYQNLYNTATNITDGHQLLIIHLKRVHFRFLCEYMLVLISLLYSGQADLKSSLPFSNVQALQPDNVGCGFVSNTKPVPFCFIVFHHYNYSPSNMSVLP